MSEIQTIMNVTDAEATAAIDSIEDACAALRARLRDDYVNSINTRRVTSQLRAELDEAKAQNAKLESIIAYLIDELIVHKNTN